MGILYPPHPRGHLYRLMLITIGESCLKRCCFCCCFCWHPFFIGYPEGRRISTAHNDLPVRVLSTALDSAAAKVVGGSQDVLYPIRSLYPGPTSDQPSPSKIKISHPTTSVTEYTQAVEQGQLKSPLERKKVRFTLIKTVIKVSFREQSGNQVTFKPPLWPSTHKP
jgi:hypothetical protein